VEHFSLFEGKNFAANEKFSAQRGKKFAQCIAKIFRERNLASARKQCKPYHRIEECGVTERFAMLSTRLSTVVLKT
jgi:hypothetical protein